MAEENIEAGAEESTGTETAAPAKSLAETGVKDEADASPPADAGAEQSAASEFSWPDDWRDQMAGGDDKIKALLTRYTSPAAAAKAFRDLRVTYDTRDTKKDAAQDVELPENPTPEQLAEYRKAKGVPESPDLYEFEAPEGKELSEADMVIMNDFAQAMHERNMPASVVRDISGWFLEYEETVAQSRAEAAYNARIQTEEKLRAEWGGDYRANVNLMSNVLQEHLGSAAGDFLSTPLADGTRIGDSENFIRLMADLARKVGGSTAELYTSDVETTGKGLEARKAELMKMMNDHDPQVRKKYWGADVQSELQRIQSALSRRA
jgi:hypothetical protein